MPRLQGKVSLITGAAQGIGLATALKFAQEGATVVVCDIKQAGVDAVVAQCVAAGATAVGCVLDVTQREMVDAVVAQVKERFGRIDVLVNNAAFQMTHETFEEIPDDEWVMTFDVNITAIFRLCQAALKHMRPGASIINTSSINSDMPKPTLLAYATTKGAIANFTDVVKTFGGIINGFRKAKSEGKLKGVKIWVRRGGPREQNRRCLPLATAGRART